MAREIDGENRSTNTDYNRQVSVQYVSLLKRVKSVSK